MNASARRLALAGLRSRYPHATEAELRRKLAALLYGEEVADEFYVDKDMIAEVIQHRSSFNIIHRETMFNVDVFIPPQAGVIPAGGRSV